jgi:hypothetical protein
LKVRKIDGSFRLAVAEDYKAVRWILKKALKPGESGRVSFKARLK